MHSLVGNYLSYHRCRILSGQMSDSRLWKESICGLTPRIGWRLIEWKRSKDGYQAAGDVCDRHLPPEAEGSQIQLYIDRNLLESVLGTDN